MTKKYIMNFGLHESEAFDSEKELIDSVAQTITENFLDYLFENVGDDLERVSYEPVIKEIIEFFGYEIIKE